jgi:plastocyanin
MTIAPTMRRRFAGICFALIAAACSSPDTPGTEPVTDQPEVQSASTPLDGVYASGEYILRLDAGEWSVNQPPRAGEFTVSGDRLVLFNEEGCPGEGTYGWTLEGDELTLAKVEDLCADRNVRFPSLQKWATVHLWDQPISRGDGLLLSDGEHVANYDGREDVSGLADATISVSTNRFGLVFSPTVLIGTPGQTLRLTIQNPIGKGTERTPHNFNMDDLGIEHLEVPYGEATSVTVTFPASGGLRFYCAYHLRFGQQGELLVA